MTARWEPLEPKRPDRYLDWELRTRTPERQLGSKWCCAMVQIPLGPEGDLLAHLDGFVQDAGEAGAPFMMQADERRRLDDTIDFFKTKRPDGTFPVPEDDDPRLSFFIYLPEEDAYNAGEFAKGEHYMVRFAGPPIPGLRFEKMLLWVSNVAHPRFAKPPAAIGIIDDGIAFAHERFRTAGATRDAVQETRIAAIWLQDLETAAEDDGIIFGRRLQAEAQEGGGDPTSARLEPSINGFLRQSAALTGVINDAEVYRLAGTHDFSKSRYEPASLRLAHGTHVMDLVCGEDPNDAQAQMRSGLIPILAVQLPDAVAADTSGTNMGSYVIQGLRQIMLWADQFGRIPLVINFSYGISAGPKDGSHYLEREIKRLVEARNEEASTVVVMSAGNSHDDRMVATMALDSGASRALDWMLQPDDMTPSFVEIWLDGVGEIDACPVKVTLTPPGDPAGPETMPAPGEGRVLSDGSMPICALYYDPPARTGAEERARVFLAVNPTKSWETGRPLAPCGRWTISLTNTAATPLTARLYIQRDDTPAGFRRKGRQSYFDHAAAYHRDDKTGDYTALDPSGPITHAGTLSALANDASIVVVGGADDCLSPRPARYTSSGPTPARTGPDFSAVTEEGPSFPGVLAAGSASGSVVAMSGTSVAAPQIARALIRHQVNVSELGSNCTRLAQGVRSRLGPFFLSPRAAGIGRKRRYRERPDE